ncbi:MAG: N-6 DNA methylase [Gordonia sp. (in: high G+C Gram-positive bacteria)]|uniref:Eco57I restriction-modification methylase domain-containing protein n=1 Tax=Gordonia sp. (in: high G+C Gram-positive bacteria) TaxID=84139 RepID=UPI0039E3341A
MHMDYVQLTIPFEGALRSDEMSDRGGKFQDVTMTAAPTANYGEVFTRRWIVEAILDLVGYTADKPLYEQRLVEPSIGSGAFLIPAVERLIASAHRDGVPLHRLAGAIRGFDIQPEHVEGCRTQVAAVLEREGCSEASHLANTWISRADFLHGPREQNADYVVGNPPYIRTENLDAESDADYRKRWPTMRGRADIYVGFYERGLSLLKPRGRLGFICADRWMRNQYGKALREFVTDGFAVEHVWTMHDVDAFETEVSAYPAITVLSHNVQGKVVVADAGADFAEASARELVTWSLRQDYSSAKGVGFSAHRLQSWFDGRDYWPTGDPARLRLVDFLAKNFRPLSDPATGTRVSIGVASGADSDYVVTDRSIVESDRLLPMSMVRDLQSGKFRWSGHYLVNPWGPDGRLVALDDYPALSRYLSNRPAIRRRYVARKNPNTWYRTIDRVDPTLVDRPKLLLQDMRTTINPVLEPGGYYPHHNLYYIVSDEWDLEVLGGLLLSEIAQAYIEAFCVKMRGGTLRFQAQYLKRVPVPNMSDFCPEVEAALRDAFRARDVEGATIAACRAYGISAAGLTPTFDLKDSA